MNFAPIVPGPQQGVLGGGQELNFDPCFFSLKAGKVLKRCHKRHPVVG